MWMMYEIIRPIALSRRTQSYLNMGSQGRLNLLNGGGVYNGETCQRQQWTGWLVLRMRHQRAARDQRAQDRRNIHIYIYIYSYKCYRNEHWNKKKMQLDTGDRYFIDPWGKIEISSSRVIQHLSFLNSISHLFNWTRFCEQQCLPPLVVLKATHRLRVAGDGWW